MKNYGYVKSKLDGKEIIYNTKQSANLPSKYSYIGFLGDVVNQGSINDCVACGTSSVLEYNGISMTLKDIENLFKKAPHTSDGMEIKVMLNYLKENPYKGFSVHSFGLVKSEIMLKYALIANGVCLCGLPVRNPDVERFWNGSSLQGGHCVAIVGWNEKGFLIRNSWGQSYGQKGYGCVPYEDFKQFLEIWTIIS